MSKIKVGMIARASEDTIFPNCMLIISKTREPSTMGEKTWWVQKVTGTLPRRSYWLPEYCLINARWPSKLERLVYNLAQD